MHIFDDDEIHALLVAYGGKRLQKVIKRKRNMVTVLAISNEGSLSIIKMFFCESVKSSPIYQTFITKLQAMKRMFSKSKCIHIQAVRVITDQFVILERPFYHRTLHQRIREYDDVSTIDRHWFAFQLLSALQEFHQQDVAHGSLSCNSVFVTDCDKLIISEPFLGMIKSLANAVHPIKASSALFQDDTENVKNDISSLGQALHFIYYGYSPVVSEAFPLHPDGQSFAIYSPTMQDSLDKVLRDIHQCANKASLSIDSILETLRETVIPGIFYSYLHGYFSLLSDNLATCIRSLHDDMDDLFFMLNQTECSKVNEEGAEIILMRYLLTLIFRGGNSSTNLLLSFELLDRILQKLPPDSVNRYFLPFCLEGLKILPLESNICLFQLLKKFLPNIVIQKEFLAYAFTKIVKSIEDPFDLWIGLQAIHLFRSAHNNLFKDSQQDGKALAIQNSSDHYIVLRSALLNIVHLMHDREFLLHSDEIKTLITTNTSSSAIRRILKLGMLNEVNPSTRYVDNQDILLQCVYKPYSNIMDIVFKWAQLYVRSLDKAVIKLANVAIFHPYNSVRSKARELCLKLNEKLDLAGIKPISIDYFEIRIAIITADEYSATDSTASDEAVIPTSLTDQQKSSLLHAFLIADGQQ